MIDSDGTVFIDIGEGCHPELRMLAVSATKHRDPVPRMVLADWLDDHNMMPEEVAAIREGDALVICHHPSAGTKMSTACPHGNTSDRGCPKCKAAAVERWKASQLSPPLAYHAPSSES